MSQHSAQEQNKFYSTDEINIGCGSQSRIEVNFKHDANLYVKLPYNANSVLKQIICKVQQAHNIKGRIPHLSLNWFLNSICIHVFTKQKLSFLDQHDKSNTKNAPTSCNGRHGKKREIFDTRQFDTGQEDVGVITLTGWSWSWPGDSVTLGLAELWLKEGK